MDLAIPDGREVLDMDRLTAMLRRCRRFAVMPCVCRTIEENKHARRCDFPIEDVCVTFDQAAEAVISSGAGREVTMEELLEIVRRCRDMGLVQVISNAEHPLALCNCCSCCCLCLRTLQRYEDIVCGPARFEPIPSAGKNASPAANVKNSAPWARCILNTARSRSAAANAWAAASASASAPAACSVWSKSPAQKRKCP